MLCVNMFNECLILQSPALNFSFAIPFNNQFIVQSQLNKFDLLNLSKSLSIFS